MGYGHEDHPHHTGKSKQPQQKTPYQPKPQQKQVSCSSIQETLNKLDKVKQLKNYDKNQYERAISQTQAEFDSLYLYDIHCKKTSYTKNHVYYYECNKIQSAMTTNANKMQYYKAKVKEVNKILRETDWHYSNMVMLQDRHNCIKAYRP